MNIKNKFFTLIELLIVLVIVGILTAIVVPNIGSFKSDSTTVAIQSNIRNIETGLTMYQLENDGKLPILNSPAIGEPEKLLLKKMYPDYIRSMPTNEKVTYWVDYSSKVWASTAALPKEVTYSSAGLLEWEKTDNAVSFNIFRTQPRSSKTNASNKEILFVDSFSAKERNAVDLPKLNSDDFYLVSSVDSFGLETPPIKEGFVGEVDSSTPNPNQDHSLGLSFKEDFPWNSEVSEVLWKNTSPALTDNDDSTYYNVDGNKDYLIEWEGDLSHRVFRITYSTGYGGISKDFNFLDDEGREIPFINAKTDEKHSTYSVGNYLTKRTIEFVVPVGSTKLRIHGSSSLSLFEANFVKDLTLPHSVENVYSEATKDSLTIKWSPPKKADNFQKVAIYEGEKFLGYSSDGTYKITPLYSDTEHSYSLEPVSVVGNRGQKVKHTNRTIRPKIIWRGLNNAGGFDNSLDTYAVGSRGAEITWIGNLENRQINLIYNFDSSSYTEYGILAFYNEKNQEIPSLNVPENIISNSHKLTGNETPRSASFVVPEGAVKIKVLDVSSNNRPISFKDISEGNSEEFPSQLNEVSTTSTIDSITLLLNKPKDVVKVAIYRDGVLIDYTDQSTYVDKMLYSNQEYIYTFDTFNLTGNRTLSAGSIKGKTQSKSSGINWRGLNNANAFDSSPETFSLGSRGSEITWEGDLSNKQINMIYNFDTSFTEYGQLAFYNERNQEVPSLRVPENTISGSHKITGNYTEKIASFVVPEGAVKIKVLDVSSNNRPPKFYTISEGDSGKFPNRLEKVLATSTTDSITLNLNKPEDVSRITIYRDGVLLGYTNENVYVDNILYSDREYTYTFDTFNSTGNRTVSAGLIKVKTKSAETNWSGLNDAGAFDASVDTYSIGKAGYEISWSGNIANRQIEILYTFNTAYTEYADLVFYDSKNNQISSLRTTDNVTSLSHRLTGNNISKSVSFLVPVGAVKLRIMNISSNNRPIQFNKISVKP